MLGGKSNMVGAGIQTGSLGCVGIVRGQGRSDVSRMERTTARV